MNDVKKDLLQVVEDNADRLFAIACDLWEHPEYGREEYCVCDNKGNGSSDIGNVSWVAHAN